MIWLILLIVGATLPVVLYQYYAEGKISWGLSAKFVVFGFVLIQVAFFFLKVIQYFFALEDNGLLSLLSLFGLVIAPLWLYLKSKKSEKKR